MRKSESLDSSFSTVRTEGGLLPADILAKVLAGDSAIPGTSPDAYHLPKGEKLNEAINRSWTRVRALWEKFRLQCETLEETDTGTTQTRETLLLPLFAELGYGRLFGAKAEERTVDDKVFSISHFWHHSPIHLIGCKVDLDRKSSGVRGAAQSSPHSMVQDFLNRSEAHLWGFCSNGLRLRILRDNQSLSRQAFIEFDLESMFEGEVFSDFALLWLLCHQSRVESDNPSACWLEQWARSAQDQGIRALETLRGSVQKTIEILGQGFLESHNPELKERLRSGALPRQDYFRQLLRLVYRLLFLFAAEDRGLLHAPGVPEEVKKRYAAWHSTTRLRRLAGNLSGTRHHDLYEGLKLLMGYLGSEEGCPALGLSPLGSFLWAADALPDVHSARLSNGHLLHAVRALAYTETEGIRRPVDYKNVGARELGSIYESLLELHPVLDTISGAFSLETASGNERKTTGSYYTPTSLIENLLDSALEPVTKQAIARENPEQALLELNICDPACGSGHFLIAAAHRLAKRLAGVRTGDEEPGPDAVRKALRDVIGRCIYGVDVNPMAVELCKVSLWLEALEPGKPLSFLDHHIRCGNSLIGATPELIAGGLPDEAFKPIEGDEKAACSALKKANKAAQKKARMPLIAQQEKEVQERLREAAAALEAIPSDNLRDIQAKENAFKKHESTPEYQSKRDLANTWCAAFVIRKYFPEKPGYPGVPADEPFGLTQRELNALAMGRPLAPELGQEVERIAAQYQFLHWHLAYPEVFARGGFDVILGNPPWENLQTDAQEFFSHLAPAIADAQNMSKRNKLISKLERDDPELLFKWKEQIRRGEATRLFIKHSGVYKLSTFGRLNTYSLFAEVGERLINSSGRAGMVLPVGIATDAFNQHYFSSIVKNGKLISLYGFENEEFIFQGVHHSFKFALMTIGTSGSCYDPELAFYLRSADAAYVQQRKYRLLLGDFELINPNTTTCPVFKTRNDALITAHIYRRCPVIINEKTKANPWNIKCQLMFMMNTVTDDVKTIADLAREGIVIDTTKSFDIGSYLPLVEGKMFHQFDHRFGTYFNQTQAQANQGKLPELTEDDHASPFIQSIPQYWVENDLVVKALSEFSKSKWLVSWRDVTSSVVYRTAISAIVPLCAASDSAPIIHFNKSNPLHAAQLVSIINSFVFDFVTRQKLGGNHLRFYSFYQLPTLTPVEMASNCPWGSSLGIVGNWIATRHLELTYTAWVLQPFAQDCGFDGPPFRWDEARRFLLRCELDAAFFHLYLPANPDGTWKSADGETDAEMDALTKAFPTPRHAVDYIMDTFPIVKRKDEAAHGEYRTKRVILEIYDELQQAMATGKPFQTRLDPPPADPRCCHPGRTE